MTNRTVHQRCKSYNSEDMLFVFVNGVAGVVARFECKPQDLTHCKKTVQNITKPPYGGKCIRICYLKNTLKSDF